VLVTHDVSETGLSNNLLNAMLIEINAVPTTANLFSVHPMQSI